jgi:hypothetical protein
VGKLPKSWPFEAVRGNFPPPDRKTPYGYCVDPEQLYLMERIIRLGLN